MGVHARRDDGGADFVAVFENDSGGAALMEKNSCDSGFRADFSAGFARGAGNGVGDGTGAAAAEAPGAEGAVNLAHVVVEQNVGRAGRANAEERADDP